MNLIHARFLLRSAFSFDEWESVNKSGLTPPYLKRALKMQEARTKESETLEYQIERAETGEPRRRSRFRLLDHGKHSAEYYPVDECSTGVNAAVRRCTSKDGEEVVVKAPRPRTSHTVDRSTKTLGEEYVNQVKHEVEMFKRAYPHFRSLVQFFGPEKKYYTYRHVQSFIPGLTLQHFVQKIYLTEFNVVLDIFIAVINELARMHDLKMCHGDLKWDNVIVSKKKVAAKVSPEADSFRAYFIDFSLSYLLTDKKIRLFSEEIKHFAPERCDITEIAPHPAQDISSLLYTLHEALETIQKRQLFPENTETICELLNYFITSRTIEPDKRPSLDQIKEKIASCKNEVKCGVGLSQ